MEQASPKYMISLINKIKTELKQQYSSSDIRAYLTRWIEYYDAFNQNFGISLYDNGELDLDTTLNNIDDETLLKIAIDLEIDTPDFLPSIPIFKNEVKSSYKTAGKTFELACKKVNDEPGIAVSLANAALESIIKEILKDKRLFDDDLYNDNDTLYKLTEKCLKKLKAHPSQHIPDEIKRIGSGLLKCCQAIENIRSDETVVTHGKTDTDTVIEDPILAFFIINAVSTIGLFLLELYQKEYPSIDPETDIELPF